MGAQAQLQVRRTDRVERVLQQLQARTGPSPKDTLVFNGPSGPFS